MRHIYLLIGAVWMSLHAPRAEAGTGETAAVSASDLGLIRTQVLIGGRPAIEVYYAAKKCRLGGEFQMLSAVVVPAVHGSTGIAAVDDDEIPLVLRQEGNDLAGLIRYDEVIHSADSNVLISGNAEHLYGEVFANCDLSMVSRETWTKWLTANGRASRIGAVALVAEWLAFQNGGLLPCDETGLIVGSRRVCADDLRIESKRCIARQQCQFLYEWLVQMPRLRSAETMSLSRPPAKTPSL